MKFELKTLLTNVLVSALVAILLPTCTHGQIAELGGAKGQIAEANPTQVVRDTDKRTVFDAGPFSHGHAMPYWDKGYLISLTPQTGGPGIPNVTLYASDGQKVREAAVWFPGAETVFILSAAVTAEGNILASGTAVKSDGTRAYYIARTDLAGRVTDVIQTNPFFPAHVCSASDGTVWSFGDAGVDPPNDSTLRQFDLATGLLKSYLPHSSFGGGPRAPAERGNPGQEVYFRCSGSRIAIYSGVVNYYIEFNTTSGSVKRYHVDRSSVNLPVRGFALTSQGEVYGFLRDYSKPELQGLFHLEPDAKNAVVKWVPVEGASGGKGQAGVFQGLWGADGETLIHGYADDPAGWTGVSRSIVVSTASH